MLTLKNKHLYWNPSKLTILVLRYNNSVWKWVKGDTPSTLGYLENFTLKDSDNQLCDNDTLKHCFLSTCPLSSGTDERRASTTTTFQRKASRSIFSLATSQYQTTSASHEDYVCTTNKRIHFLSLVDSQPRVPYSWESRCKKVVFTYRCV